MATHADKVESHLQLVLAKLEVGHGTDPTPVETDAVWLRNFKAEPVFSFLEMPTVQPVRASQGKNLATIHYKVSFEMNAVGAGDPDTDPLPEPNYGIFLKACEMAVASSGSPTDTHVYSYTTRTAQQSITLYIVRFKKNATTQQILKLHGLKLTHKLSIGSDAPGIFSFEGLAMYGGRAVGALTLANVDYGDAIEQVDAVNGKGMTLTLGGTTQHAQKFELTSNRTVGMTKSVAGQYHGVQEIDVNSKPGACFLVKMDPLEPIIVTGDHWEALLAESTAAMQAIWDSVQGTRLQIDAPGAQRGAWTHVEEDGCWRLDNEFYLRDSAADAEDAVSYTITRTP